MMRKGFIVIKPISVQTGIRNRVPSGKSSRKSGASSSIKIIIILKSVLLKKTGKPAKSGSMNIDGLSALLIIAVSCAAGYAKFYYDRG